MEGIEESLEGISDKVDDVGKVLDKSTGQLVEITGTIVGTICKSPVTISGIYETMSNPCIMRYNDYILYASSKDVSGSNYPSVWRFNKNGNFITSVRSVYSESIWISSAKFDRSFISVENDIVKLCGSKNSDDFYDSSHYYDARYNVFYTLTSENIATNDYICVSSYYSSSRHIAMYTRGPSYDNTFYDFNLSTIYGFIFLGAHENTVFVMKLNNYSQYETPASLLIINLAEKSVTEVSNFNQRLRPVYFDERYIYMVYVSSDSNFMQNKAYIYDMLTKNFTVSGGSTQSIIYGSGVLQYVYSDDSYGYFLVGNFYCRINLSTGDISYVKINANIINTNLTYSGYVSVRRFGYKLGNSDYVPYLGHLISYDKANMFPLYLLDSRPGSYSNGWPTRMSENDRTTILLTLGNSIPYFASGYATSYDWKTIYIGDDLAKIYTNFGA